MNNKLSSALSWIITVLVPVFLILLGVRLLLNPALLPIEYSMPGFPDDLYGFTRQDRLEWGTYAVNYLLNDAGPEYLGDLRFADGIPAFNEREVSHMLDVKIVVQGALRALALIAVALVGLGVWAWRGGWLDDFRRGAARGGWLAFYLVVVPVVFVAGVFLVSGPQGLYYLFWNFFAGFHAIFFVGDSWLFEYSDTLIRLFPLRFWQDMFIYIFGFTALVGALLGWLVKPKRA